MLALILLPGCKSFTIPEDADPINELPMYGGEREPYQEKRPSASKKAAEEGWDCLYNQKDLRNAMKFFNRAWMLDSDNPKAYWGMGIVVGIEAEDIADPVKRMGSIDKSIKFLEKAQSLDTGNALIMGSLAKAYMDKACRLEDKTEKEKLLKMAEEIFINAGKISPKGVTYFNLSVCLYHQDRYDESWKMLLKANELNYKIPPDYLNNLKNKLNK